MMAMKVHNSEIVICNNCTRMTMRYIYPQCNKQTLTVPSIITIKVIEYLLITTISVCIHPSLIGICCTVNPTV